jgi:hypothetical protein
MQSFNDKANPPPFLYCLIIDNFAGGGGACTGIEIAPGGRQTSPSTMTMKLLPTREAQSEGPCGCWPVDAEAANVFQRVDDVG